MSLHEQMAADLDSVFLNNDEFACIHEINGRQIRCIVDDVLAQAQSGVDSGFDNVTALGLLQADRVVYCLASDVIPQPLPGQQLVMDGVIWLVADSGVAETEGMLTLPLRRAF